jgi:hypothetical protein
MKAVDFNMLALPSGMTMIVGISKKSGHVAIRTA